MSVDIISTPPSKKDSPKVLREKLLDTDLWTDSSGRPDAKLLRSILGWPGCYLALRLWIERDALPYGTAGHLNIPDPPAAPHESFFKKLRTHTIRRSHPVKERKPSRLRKLKKKKLAKRQLEDASADEDGVAQLEQLAETAPKVSKSFSWQNVRRPLLIGLSILVAAGLSVSGVAVARQQDEARQYSACTQAVRALGSEKGKLSRERNRARKMYEETPASTLSYSALYERLGKVISFKESGQQLSCSVDPECAQKNAKKSLRLVSSRLRSIKSVENQVTLSRLSKSRPALKSSIRTAKSTAKLPVEDPSLVDSLKSEIDTATQLVSSRKASWRKLDLERHSLDQKTKTVSESAKQKKADDKRKADERSKTAQQPKTESSQKTVPSRPWVSKKTPTTGRRYVPVRPQVTRRSVPQQSQSAPQTWNVPSQGCTEGCLG